MCLWLWFDDCFWCLLLLILFDYCLIICFLVVLVGLNCLCSVCCLFGGCVWWLYCVIVLVLKAVGYLFIAYCVCVYSWWFCVWVFGIWGLIWVAVVVMFELCYLALFWVCAVFDVCDLFVGFWCFMVCLCLICGVYCLLVFWFLVCNWFWFAEIVCLLSVVSGICVL